mgnify:FL=1
MLLNPNLPFLSDSLSAKHTQVHRKECGKLFYMSCLELSQSYWLQGKPAQAILQINKAFMADIKTFIYPAPYMALKWFLENRREGQFIGNPVRHFQHLATRMSGPRKELRACRAWCCFFISKHVLPQEEFPEDFGQIYEELLIVPSIEEVYSQIRSLGLRNEHNYFKKSVIPFL